LADSRKLIADSLAKRAYQIDIEKPGVRVSHLTTGFFYAHGLISAITGVRSESFDVV